MFTLSKLLHLPLMAFGTSFRCRHPHVVAFSMTHATMYVTPVAIPAAHFVLTVCAQAPVGDDVWRLLFMTLDTLLTEAGIGVKINCHG